MKKNKGFTLVELLAVIVILAIIMIIAIPSVLSTLTTARKKTFVEYIDKVYQAAEKKVLSKEMLGEKTSCVLFDITSDLGIDNTGDFKGYVIPVKDSGKYKYFITLWDNNYMVYALEYKGTDNDQYVLDYDSTKTNELSADYLAVVAGCTSFIEEKTKEEKHANPSGPVPYTGTKEGANEWIAHYTNGVMDECYQREPSNFCTGTFIPNITNYDPANYPDLINICLEHKSLECCTSNKTEDVTSNHKYTKYIPRYKSCGCGGIETDGKYYWMYNINPGGGLPASGVTYEVTDTRAK